MPTFDTPRPIQVDIDVYVANVTVTAEDRADTVITVDPTDPGNASDVEAAEQTRVELSNDVVTVKGPKLRAYVLPTNKSRAIDISVTVPTGSTVTGSAPMMTFRSTGRLGACEVKSGMGNIAVDRAGPVKLRTVGDIHVDEAAGDAKLSTGSGRLRIGHVGGNLHTKNSNGATVVGSVDGNVKIRSSNGDITVTTADGDVEAVSALGNIRVGELRRGDCDLKTATGEIEIGIGEGTAAWIEAHSGFGAIRNQLTDATQPAPGEPTVKVRARNSYGDIVIRRSEI